MTTTTTTFTVSASADDGYVYKATSSASTPTSGWGTPSNSGNSLIIGVQEDWDNWPNFADHFLGYFRFQNVTVAQGATISSAYLKPYQNSYTGRTLSVKGFDKDNVSAPTAGSDLAASNFTTAGITNFVTTTGEGQKTSPDIKDIIQEIVDRSGWSSGNSMMFALWIAVSSVSTHILNLRSYDYSSGSEACELVIEYESGPSGETVTPDAAVAVATGTDPTVTEGESGETVTPAEAIAVATGTAPTVTITTTVIPAVAVSVATGTDPTIESGSTLTPTVASFIATAIPPTVNIAVAGYIVTPTEAISVATSTNPAVSIITAEVLVQPAEAVSIVTATIHPVDRYGLVTITNPKIAIPEITNQLIDVS